jgi:hypothetical protein
MNRQAWKPEAQNFRMKYITILCSAAFAILLATCGKAPDGTRQLEPYYYPLAELREGRVYEYEPLGDEQDPPVYWLYRSKTEGAATYLHGTSYGPRFEVDQYVREERVANGMLLTDFFVYEVDEEGRRQPLRADIEASNVFPFRAKPLASALLTSLHWRPLGDSSSITLVRNRQFDSDTTVMFQGKQLPAVKFNTRELVDQEEQGHLELEFGGTELYGKGLGLVHFRKDVSGQRRIEYRLKQTYSLQEFEEKYKTKLEEGKGN